MEEGFPLTQLCTDEEQPMGIVRIRGESRSPPYLQCINQAIDIWNVRNHSEEHMYRVMTSWLLYAYKISPNSLYGSNLIYPHLIGVSIVGSGIRHDNINFLFHRCKIMSHVQYSNSVCVLNSSINISPLSIPWPGPYKDRSFLKTRWEHGRPNARTTQELLYNKWTWTKKVKICYLIPKI